MKSEFLFIIITPVYNREDCIERCIQSVQNNSFKDFEHIIIDDGSSDRTYSIVSALKEKYKNITLIKNPGNKGVCFSFNRGIEKAKGDYIIFLGSDDTITPDALQTINDTIDNNPDYKHYLFLPDDMVESYKNVKKLQKDNAVIEFKDWLSGEIWGDFVHVIKRECFDDIKFDENYRIYEGITFLQLYKKNKEQFFTNKVISIRERDRNDSVTKEYELKRKESINSQYRIIKKQIEDFEEEFKKFGLNERFQYLIERAIILGLASGEYQGAGLLFTKSESNLKIELLKFIHKLRLGALLRQLIFLKSKINTLKKKLI